MSTFKPLTFELIEQGQLRDDADSELRRVQEELCAFVRLHGKRAAKAKASVTVKIELACADPEEGFYTVKAQVKSSVPCRPVRATSAMVAMDADRHVLFCRASGTTEDHPRQTVAFTERGEVVDTETGEVKTK